MAKRKKKAGSEELFAEWWRKKAEKMVSKIEKDWVKKNEPNSEDEEGGDHWHVNRMMHDGDAHEMTWEIAERAFRAGHNGEKWEPDMGDSLFCDLDEVIELAYLAGKESVS